MSIDPIQFVLSNYNKLSILRKQLDDRTRESEEIEASIREILLYVKSISSAYATLDSSEQMTQLSALESRRSLLHDLLKTLHELLVKTETEAKNGKATSTDSPAPRTLEKNSFTEKPAVQPSTTTPNNNSADATKKSLSFDDFRKKFPSSGV